MDSRASRNASAYSSGAAARGRQISSPYTGDFIMSKQHIPWWAWPLMPFLFVGLIILGLLIEFEFWREGVRWKRMWRREYGKHE